MRATLSLPWIGAESERFGTRLLARSSLYVLLMGGRFKSAPARQADAFGYVEMRIAGRMMQVSWSMTGDTLTIVSPVGQHYTARRDPTKGSEEDQARGMILELWTALRERLRPE